MKLFHLVVLLLASALLAAAVTYTYDDAGRLVLVDYGNGSTIAYTYDKAGNLLSRTVTSSSGSGTAKVTSKDKAPAPQKSAKPKPMSLVHFLTGRSV